MNLLSEKTHICSEIIEAARKYDMPIAGGPMLGNLGEDGVDIWLRPSTSDPLVISVISSDGSAEKSFVPDSLVPGVVQKKCFGWIDC